MTQETLILPGGLPLRCYVAGQGARTIVLLRGAGVDSAMMSWSEVLPLLAAEGYRVIAPDLPGYGGSGQSSGDYSLPFYSAAIADFIETLDCGPVILSGLSLGGGIALHLALERPELLEALIPVDAWGLFAKLPWHRTLHWFARSRLNRGLYPWAGKHRWIIKWSLTASLFGDKRKVTDELLDTVMEALSQPDAGEPFRSFQICEIGKAGLNTELFGRLPELQLPTLLVHGEKDAAVPLAGAIEAQKRIAGAELHIMRGCRHWPQKERPEEFAAEMLRFLRALPPRGACI